MRGNFSKVQTETSITRAVGSGATSNTDSNPSLDSSWTLLGQSLSAIDAADGNITGVTLMVLQQ